MDHRPLRHSLKILCFLAALFAAAPRARSQQPGSPQNTAQPGKLPANTILVKGAWSSASDSLTPVPEGGTLAGGVYTNKYFGIAYTLPPGWSQKYSGPPPSDSGYYVLAQITNSDAGHGAGGASRGSILIAAQDQFFSLAPAATALELIDYTRDKLPPDYKVERAPTPLAIAGRPFVRFDYYSPAAGLHWYVLATEIRCHVVEFVFTGRDTSLLAGLVRGLSGMKLPAQVLSVSSAGGEEVPACLKGYARDRNIVDRADPVFTQRRFNPIPVRIVIGKDGNVKHIHFASAFPDQAKSISDALSQWKFKPYLLDGQPADLETGIMFGHAPRIPTSGSQAVDE